MAIKRSILYLFALCAILNLAFGQVSQGGGHTSQGGTNTPQGGGHENQGRARRQANQDYDDAGPPGSLANWTTCDITVSPRISCQDCNTRLICKPVGGLLKTCGNPSRPYCNLGVCSPIPSAECA